MALARTKPLAWRHSTRQATCAGQLPVPFLGGGNRGAQAKIGNAKTRLAVSDGPIGRWQGQTSLTVHGKGWVVHQPGPIVWHHQCARNSST